MHIMLFYVHKLRLSAVINEHDDDEWQISLLTFWQCEVPAGPPVRTCPSETMTVQTIIQRRMALAWLSASKLHIQHTTVSAACIQLPLSFRRSPPAVYRLSDDDRRRIKELWCRAICDDAAAANCCSGWRWRGSGWRSQHMAVYTATVDTYDARNCVMSRYVTWPRLTTLPPHTNNKTSRPRCDIAGDYLLITQKSL